MRLFPEELEEAGYRRTQVRKWRDSGLIGADQARRILEDSPAVLSETGWPLRVMLSFFALLAAGAGAGFLYFLLDLPSESFLILGLGLALAAEGWARRKKSLEDGVVFGLSLAALVCLGIGGAEAFDAFFSGHGLGSWSCLAFLLGLAALLSWLRHGQVPMVFVSALFFSMVPELWPGLGRAETVTATALFLALLTGLAWAWRPRGDLGKQRRAVFVAAGILATLVQLNLALKDQDLFNMDREMGWWTWWGYPPELIAVCFVLGLTAPVLILGQALRRRDRYLLIVGAILALLGLVTFKPYLGLSRHVWDPAILGFGLLGLALGLSRWLESGPGRRRGAFTSQDLMNPRFHGLEPVAASVVGQLTENLTQQAPSGPGHGGRSGGAGASGSF